jgi:aspartokinase-like uncharacterized kinase
VKAARSTTLRVLQSPREGLDVDALKEAWRQGFERVLVIVGSGLAARVVRNKDADVR